MVSYKIACVSMDYDAAHDDCRAITAIGFETEDGHITTRSPAAVHDMIVQDDVTVVVEYHGEQTALEPVTEDGVKYVRSASTDTADDALLKQPSC